MTKPEWLIWSALFALIMFTSVSMAYTRGEWWLPWVAFVPLFLFCYALSRYLQRHR